MNIQERRVRDTYSAPVPPDDLTSCSDADLERLVTGLFNALLAAQSTDYMGSPEAQAAFNEHYEKLEARYKAVKAELERRTGE